ncbi:MAG: nitroreductase family protein [candidate division SR1 bacterium]|nr:nitroreductase family protein [candidate division SR1 bacterium]
MPTPQSLEDIIKTRRSIRHFTKEIPSDEIINQIVTTAIYAPFGGATNIPFDEMRKIFILKQGSEKMNQAKKLLLAMIRKNSKGLHIIIKIFPFLKKKMGFFAKLLSNITQHGIPGLETAPYYIIIAEKKGFPPVEKQSIAHAMQNMWLMATHLGLGFQLLTATSMMSKNKEFMALLGLKKGTYTIDGCLFGYATTYPEEVKQFEKEKFVTWL